MISRINSLLSITLVVLLASTFHLHDVDARRHTLRGEGYHRAAQDLNYDTVDDDNNTGDRTHDHTALKWAGSGSGVCPRTIPTDGGECDRHVSPNSSQISCTYNNFQCNCALHNNINDLIGWACRDTTPASGP